MSKYGQAIGIFNLTVGGADFKLKPKKGDNLALMEIVNGTKDKADQFFNKMIPFIRKIIARDYPPESPGENEELDMYVEFNIVPLVQEMMIAFRWTTRETLEKTQSEEAKKLIGGN